MKILFNDSVPPPARRPMAELVGWMPVTNPDAVVNLHSAEYPDHTVTSSGELNLTFVTSELLSEDRSRFYPHVTTVVASSFSGNDDWYYSPQLGRMIPHMNIEKAEVSTSMFLSLINDMPGKLSGSEVFQIGTNKAAITSALARYSDRVIAVDNLYDATLNGKVTLSFEVDEVKDRAFLIHGDMDLFRTISHSYDTRAKFLFFNCPVFYGTENTEMYAGNKFEIPKRALKLLPDVLLEGGEGYFLAVNSKNPLEADNYWTLEKLGDFLSEEMPDWKYEDVGYVDYSNPLAEDTFYTLVRVYKKKN